MWFKNLSLIAFFVVGVCLIYHAVSESPEATVYAIIGALFIYIVAAVVWELLIHR